MVFLVVMYRCESWTIKKAEGRRIDAFELWCWRRLLRVPWTARRSNLRTDYPKGDQSWIFFGRTDAEVEAPIIWPPDVKNWLIGKDPDAGKDWRQKEKGWQRLRWLDGITDRWTWVWASSGSWGWTGKPGMLQSMGLQRVRHDWVTELNWCEGKPGMNKLSSFYHMYECESWTIKKAECQRIDAFELWEDSWKSLGLQGEPTSPS